MEMMRVVAMGRGLLSDIIIKLHQMPIRCSSLSWNDSVFCGAFCRVGYGFRHALRFQLRDFLRIDKEGGIPPLDVGIAALAEAQPDYRLMSLPGFLLYRPFLIYGHGGLESAFLRECPYLAHDERELAEVDGADALQIINASTPPVLVFLLRQYADFHQHIHRRSVAPALTLMIHGGMYLAGQFAVSHACVPNP